MRFERVTAIVVRQFDLMRGSPARVLPLFAWVAIDIVLWGFITKYLNGVSGPGVDFVPALLGAVLLWDFFTRVMQGVTTAFFEDVWSRNFLNIFATPLSITEYLLGLVGTSLLTSAVGLGVMLVLAWAAFGLSYLIYGAMLGAFLGVLVLFGIALGVVGCSIVLRLGPASEWFVWPIPALLSPFAGVFYPISTLPVGMRWVSWCLPPAWVFEGMRGVLRGGTGAGAGWMLLWGMALSLGYIAAATWVFTRVYRHAVRTGLIARYSAETIS